MRARRAARLDARAARHALGRRRAALARARAIWPRRALRRPSSSRPPARAARADRARRRARRGRARRGSRSPGPITAAALGARARRSTPTTSTSRWPALEGEGARAARPLPPGRAAGRRWSGATAACSRASTASRSTACAARSSRSTRGAISCASSSPGSACAGAQHRGPRRRSLRVDRAAPGLRARRGRVGARGAARARRRLRARAGSTSSASPARSSGAASRRARAGATPPTRAAPITLRAARAISRWLLAPRDRGAPATSGALRRRRATCSPRLARDGRLVLRRDRRRPPGTAPRRGRGRALGAGRRAGRVTGDGFAGLRALIEQSAPRAAPGSVGRAARRARAAGRRRAAGRSCARRAPARATPTTSLEALARQYLRRYGVVFRDLLGARAARARRGAIWCASTAGSRCAARSAAAASSRGFVGEQFALPEALDALRAIRREPPSGEVVRVSACDPLNLVGVITPGRARPGAPRRRWSPTATACPSRSSRRPPRATPNGAIPARARARAAPSARARRVTSCPRAPARRASRASMTPRPEDRAAREEYALLAALRRPPTAARCPSAACCKAIAEPVPRRLERARHADPRRARRPRERAREAAAGGAVAAVDGLDSRLSRAAARRLTGQGAMTRPRAAA